MDILRALKEKSCTVSLAARTKKECLLELARLIIASDTDLELDVVLTALEHRESQGSTGLGDGIAIPHARLEQSKIFTLGIALSKKGIDFESLDGRKTHFFFTVVGPEDQPQEYLTLLAQVSRVAKNRKALRDLRTAATPMVLRETFLQHLPEPVSARIREGQQKLLTIVLYEQKYLDDIIQLFLERGIRGASVHDSTGIKGVLSRAPLFADFLNFLKSREGQSKTISAVVPENEIQGLIKGIEDILGDLDTHSGAMVYALDLHYLKGSMEVP